MKSVSHRVVSDSLRSHGLCGPPDSSVHGILQARILGVGSHSLLQGIFSTQRSNLGLSHCRWILYHLNHQGSPVRRTKGSNLYLLVG